MATLNAARVLAGLVVTVPESAIGRHSPHSVAELGGALARAVDEWVRRERLGYYPPLDFIQSRGGLDEDLVDVLEQLAWLSAGLAQQEIRSRLRPLFAGVRFKSVQTVAYGMPPVRPGQNNALRRLAGHYTPNRLRLDLEVTLFRRAAGDEQLTAYVRRVCYRHLREPFADVEVGNVINLE